MKPIRLVTQAGDAVLVNPELIALVEAHRVEAEIRCVADGVDELVTPSYVGSKISLAMIERGVRSASTGREVLVVLFVKEAPDVVYSELYHARSWREGSKS